MDVCGTLARYLLWRGVSWLLQTQSVCEVSVLLMTHVLAQVFCAICLLRRLELGWRLECCLALSNDLALVSPLC